MPSGLTSNLLCTIILVVLVSGLPKASAFGSGNIPDAAYLKGKAWRHGDIEDTLEGLAKVAGESGGAMVGAIASALLGAASGSFGRDSFRGGKKFTGLDVKRIYFGNWLRDLSQVCDIAGFKAMTPESLVICIMTMGFLSFGYATREFQVTRERLAVYLLTEHIDNPKGYAEGEDPRKYDPRLRPPVDEARELRVDERNGMKMYIASDDQGFDTSTACIRRVFRKCIELGRQARQEGNEEKEFESFRLLGTGLHTLEDFSAHSNWCELALQKLGHKDVFAHVGENVKVNSPEGPVPPLVTGTFAGADFCFSMLGEASDKLSSASIADLTAQLDSAQDANKKPGGINLGFIKTILSKLPMGGNDSEVQNDLASMDQKKHAFDLDGRIDQIAPAELQTKIWDLFKVRDNLMRRIEELIQGIPGLGEILDNLSLSLAQWVMVTIDPFVRPILLQASSAIGQGSQAVISGNDQWTVFNDPNASDPTHSVLAKDHFSNILNDPAGNISIIIVKYTVGLMVEAWSNTENPDRVIDRILEAIHHPNYANRNSKIQRDMLEYMQKWLKDMDRDERELTIKSLSKDSVRNHRNQRKTSKGGVDPRIGGGASSHGHSHPAYQQASMLGGPHSESQNNDQSKYSNTSFHSQSQHISASLQSQGQYGNQHGRTSAEPQSKHDHKYGSTGSQSEGQYHGQYGITNKESQNQYDGKYGSSDSQAGGQYGNQYGRTSAEPQNKYDHKYGNTGSQSEGQYGSQHGRTSANSQAKYYDKYDSTGFQSEDRYGSQYGRTHGDFQGKPDNQYGSAVSQSEGQYGNQHGRKDDQSKNKYDFKCGSTGSQSEGRYGSQYGNSNAESHNKYDKKYGSAASDSRDQYGNQYGRRGFEPRNENDHTSSFPRPQHEPPARPSYEGRNDFNSGRCVDDGKQHGYDSSPAFPQVRHVGGEAGHGLGHQPAGNTYHPGNESQGYGGYNSKPSFPQPSHSDREEPYRGNNDYGHQSNTDSHGNGSYPTHSNNATNSADPSYNERYGQSSQRAPVAHRSHSRERRHDEPEFYDRGSRKDGNRHRSTSKSSNNSSDSRGSHNKNKHDKHKHKNGHDKRKKSKSPEHKQRGNQTTYQGNRYNRSFEGNNQTDSDYGMNRLNMYDRY